MVRYFDSFMTFNQIILHAKSWNFKGLFFIFFVCIWRLFHIVCVWRNHPCENILQSAANNWIHLRLIKTIYQINHAENKLNWIESDGLPNGIRRIGLHWRHYCCNFIGTPRGKDMIRYSKLQMSDERQKQSSSLLQGVLFQTHIHSTGIPLLVKD